MQKVLNLLREDPVVKVTPLVNAHEVCGTGTERHHALARYTAAILTLMRSREKLL